MGYGGNVYKFIMGCGIWDMGMLYIRDIGKENGRGPPAPRR